MRSQRPTGFALRALIWPSATGVEYSFGPCLHHRPSHHLQSCRKLRFRVDGIPRRIRPSWNALNFPKEDSLGKRWLPVLSTTDATNPTGIGEAQRLKDAERGERNLPSSIAEISPQIQSVNLGGCRRRFRQILHPRAGSVQQCRWWPVKARLPASKCTPIRRIS